jgi:hypothetical protein
MSVRYLWHGSDTARSRFGGPGEPDTLHLGTLEQASMRSGGKYLHLVEVPDGKHRRIRDKGSDNVRTIKRARKSGLDYLVYLNRYEGLSGQELSAALEKYPHTDFDAISDRDFRKIFPNQHDSLIVLDPSSVKVLGCYEGCQAAAAAYEELMNSSDMPETSGHMEYRSSLQLPEPDPYPSF